MKKFSVLIIDDEPIPRKIMREYCIQSRFFEKIDEAKDAVEALELIVQFQYDLLLLDINMPLLSGLSFAKSVKPGTKIIFVTAYAEHAVNAFELNALDYLMKPVSFERFIKAIQKLIPESQISTSSISEKRELADTSNFVLVKQGKKITKVKTENILYCEAKGNNTFIFMNDDSHINVYSPLSKLYSDMPIGLFTRIHRSYFVNNSKVKAIDSNFIYLENKTLPIGQNFKSEVERLS
jgi:DNA-binding LytR/AlgR family response regulator